MATKMVDPRFGDVVAPEDAFKIVHPALDDVDGWAALEKLKKRDIDDILFEMNPDGSIDSAKLYNQIGDWLDAAPKINLGGHGAPIKGLFGILEQHKTLRPYVIDGVIRVGECANLVAAPKKGKSWIGLNIAIHIIDCQNPYFLGKFRCAHGRVLIVDNELHEETIAWRARTVCEALGMPERGAAQWIDYMPLRGELCDIYGLEEKIRHVQKGEYALIILDALYKFYPENFRESENSDFTKLYIRLDKYAASLESSIICIHHLSKGNQVGKSVTDMGAGAGAQSRACDTHIAIRDHPDVKGVSIIEMAPRSFPAPKPFCAKFEFPIWVPAPDVNPDVEAQPWQSKRPKSVEDKEKHKSKELIDIEKFIRDIITEPTDVNSILKRGFGRGFEPWTKTRLNVLLPDLIKRGVLQEVVAAAGNKPAKYIAIQVQEIQPADNVVVKDTEDTPEYEQSQPFDDPEPESPI